MVVARPFGSDTHDDPRLISNVASIFRARHLPVPGKWLPSSVRLLENRAAVPRDGGGTSAGTGEMVRVGRQLGLQISTSLAELPAL